MANLPEITGSIPLHMVISLGFYGASTIYIVFTTILYFHWKEYSINNGVSRITLILYLLITIPIMAVLGITTLLI